jgi:hypothetical protein
MITGITQASHIIHTSARGGLLDGEVASVVLTTAVATVAGIVATVERRLFSA